jgi:hypothetical protein
MHTFGVGSSFWVSRLSLFLLFCFSRSMVVKVATPFGVDAQLVYMCMAFCFVFLCLRVRVSVRTSRSTLVFVSLIFLLYLYLPLKKKLPFRHLLT